MSAGSTIIAFLLVVWGLSAAFSHWVEKPWMGLVAKWMRDDASARLAATKKEAT